MPQAGLLFIYISCSLYKDMLNDSSADPILKAITEPRRREILRLLADSELTAGAVAGHFDVTQPAISQHLGVLKEAGLVAVRREGTRRYYRALPERVDDLREYLSRFWVSGLERLKAEAETDERRVSDASAN